MTRTENKAQRPPGAVPPAVRRPRPVVSVVSPSVDAGRYPARRIVGDLVTVTADAFADGHDAVRCELLFCHDAEKEWSAVAMRPLGNDRFACDLTLDRIGRYVFVVRSSIDRFGTWADRLTAKLQAHQDLWLELWAGIFMIDEAALMTSGPDGEVLHRAADALRSAAERLRDRSGGPERDGEDQHGEDQHGEGGQERDGEGDLGELVHSRVAKVMDEHERRAPQQWWSASPTYAIDVERKLAGFGSWYEMFPRSASPDRSRPGTLTDVVERLGYVSSLGVDVLYLPPIHPIGATNRKGRDGAALAEPSDPGSPWAIGSSCGGHMSVDPALGTIEDFDVLVSWARELGIEVALDLAYQCSPDHPWVREHPAWFRHLPDGSIAFAENPPKRYEDVYPLDFESYEWRELWDALRQVVLFWLEHGIRIFRVDNPHTKPMAFWQWLISGVRADHPEVIFLSEAFTRPRVMEHLAKIGFTQSYTYFTWRNTKREIEEYLTELTTTELVEYFRPSFWPNTPDILHATLQAGSRASFAARLVLAATLSANYGIYGPAFELLEHEPRYIGSEEYRHSEKYEIRHWQVDRSDSLAPLIRRINTIRRAHRALQQNRTLHFHDVDNAELIAYSKVATTETDGLDVVLTVVNLDPRYPQSGWLNLDLQSIGLTPGARFEVEDLLSGARYVWSGSTNYVALDPADVPAHILHVTEPVP